MLLAELQLELRDMIHDLFNYISISVVILFPRIFGANRLLLQPKSTKMVAHLSGKAFTSTAPPALISQAGAQSASSGIFEAWESRDLKSLAAICEGMLGEEPQIFFSKHSSRSKKGTWGIHCFECQLDLCALTRMSQISGLQLLLDLGFGSAGDTPI